MAFGPDIGNDEVYARTVAAHDVRALCLAFQLAPVLIE